MFKKGDHKEMLFNIDGDHVKDLRHATGLSIYQVADETGISLAELRKIEANKSGRNHACNILKLADFFDVSVDFIIGRSDTKDYQGIVQTYHDASLVRARIAYEDYLKYRSTDSAAGASPNVPVIAPWPYNLAELLLADCDYENDGSKLIDKNGHLTMPLTDDQIKGLDYVIKTRLRDREQKIIYARYRDGKTLREVAQDMGGVTHERIRQIEVRAVRKLKYPVYNRYVFFGYDTYTAKQKRYEQAKQEYVNKMEEESIEDMKRYAKTHGDVENPFSLKIEDMGLSVRSYNCLKRAGVKDMRALVSMTENELMNIRAMGRKSLKEIKDMLNKYGLELATVSTNN